MRDHIHRVVVWATSFVLCVSLLAAVVPRDLQAEPRVELVTVDVRDPAGPELVDVQERDVGGRAALIAGPSAMATLTLLTARQPEDWLNWLVATVLAWSVSLVILVFAPTINRVLRERGIVDTETHRGGATGDVDRAGNGMDRDILYALTTAAAEIGCL